MKKYYIEFVWHGSCDGVVFQSKWFDTEQGAISWFENVDYVNEVIDTYLMSAEWDMEEDTYKDIMQERGLNK